MQLYEITNGGERAVYRRKQAEAHEQAKLLVPRADVRIRLLDYPSDIGAFEGLFNGTLPQGQIKRSWALTNRGGMRELELTSAGEEVQPEPEEEAAEAPSRPTEDASAFWGRLNAGSRA